ncbi:MAG TPA: tetratricopeptide repeat protein, partial [Spirochaetes bacterium]|nr:tetratricopeptide repeat protein [Spirochaetota bacterium]
MFSRRQGSLYIILLLFLSHSLYSLDQSQAEEAKSYYLQGNELLSRGDKIEALTYFREARRLNPDSYTSYRKIARIYLGLKKYDLSRKYFSQTVRLLAKSKNSSLLSLTYTDLGDLFTAQTKYQKALSHYYKALSFLKRENNSLKKAELYAKLADTYRHLKNNTQAIRFNQKSIKIHTKHHHLKGQADNFTSLGLVYKSQSNYKLANTYFGKALEIYSKLKDKIQVGSIYIYLGDVQKDQENYSKALEFYKKSHHIAKSSGAYKRLTMIYTRLGDLFQSMGLNAKAKYTYQLGIKASSHTDVNIQLANCYKNFIGIYLKQEDYAKAYLLLHKYYYVSLQLKLNVNLIKDRITAIQNKVKLSLLDDSERTELIVVLNNIGFVYKSRHKYPTAIQYFQHALDIMDSPVNKKLSAKIYYNLGELYYEIKNYKRAKSFYEKAIPLTDNLNTLFLSRLYSSMGHIYRLEGNLKKGHKYYKMAFRISKILNVKSQLAVDYKNLGQVYFLKKQYDRALYHYIASYKL